MVQLFKYKDSEIEEILKSIVILIDTREQENSHIKDYFDKKKISYKVQKLDCGDYSFYIPKNEELGISRELFFNDIVCIERKGSLEELSGNFTKDRARIEEELSRKRGRLYLMIEGATYEDILKHNFNTKYKEPMTVITHKFIGSASVRLAL